MIRQRGVLIMGELSSVVRESEVISKEPGFEPLTGQGARGTLFLSLRVNFCADVLVPDPHTPSCVRYAPKCVRTLKIP